MHSNHPEETASRCEHSIHLSSSPHTPWCPQCIIFAAQADLERTRKRLEAEGGADAPAYMRDCAWNVARLQYIVTKRRVKKTLRKDWLRQERERIWEEAHQNYLAQYGVLPPDDSASSACVVCATLKELGQLYAKPIVSLTAVWWEREGPLVVDQLPRTRLHPTTTRKRPSQPQPGRPSYLRDLIQSYWNTRTVSDVQRRAWEDHCKIDRAVRRKYDLPEDFDIDTEFLTIPIPASHARYHHRQTRDGLYAGERRAKRHKRRAEDYKPSRSSLALSTSAEDVRVDDMELEKMRVAEEAAELRRLTNVVATEVGYLYLIGDVDLLGKWRDDVKQSNLSLIYRKSETGMGMGYVAENLVETQEGEEDEEEEDEL